MAVKLQGIKPISCARHHYTPDFIQYAVWLYLRCQLSLRDAGYLLVGRSFDISYETVKPMDSVITPVNTMNRKFDGKAQGIA